MVREGIFGSAANNRQNNRRADRTRHSSEEGEENVIIRYYLRPITPEPEPEPEPEPVLTTDETLETNFEVNVSVTGEEGATDANVDDSISETPSESRVITTPPPEPEHKPSEETYFGLLHDEEIADVEEIPEDYLVADKPEIIGKELENSSESVSKGDDSDKDENLSSIPIWMKKEVRLIVCGFCAITLVILVSVLTTMLLKSQSNKKKGMAEDQAYTFTTTCSLLEEQELVGNGPHHGHNEWSTRFNIMLHIWTDEFPEETSWVLFQTDNPDKSIISSRDSNGTSSPALGPNMLNFFDYSCLIFKQNNNNNNNSSIEEILDNRITPPKKADLSTSSVCYEFHVYDSEDNGICCSFGFGNITLSIIYDEVHHTHDGNDNSPSLDSTSTTGAALSIKSDGKFQNMLATSFCMDMEQNEFYYGKKNSTSSNEENEIGAGAF